MRVPVYLLLLLGACSHSPACQLTLATAVPLVPVLNDARLMVPVLVDQRPARLLLDTGSDTTALTDAAFRRLHALETTDHLRVISGVGGVQHLGSAELWRFSLGVLASALSIVVIDHSILPPIPPADGLLGLDSMQGYDVDLNVPGRRLGLYRAKGNCAVPQTRLTGVLHAVPMVGGTSKPRLVVVVNGIRLLAEIDSGAPNMVLFRRAADRLRLPSVQHAVRVHGIGQGAAHAADLSLAHVQVGPFDLTDMPATVIDQNVEDPVDLLLGVDFTELLHVWLSFSSNSFVIQYPPRPTGS